MQKTVALSTLQSLVSEHNKTIYQEALDCIKMKLDVLAQQATNTGSLKLSEEDFEKFYHVYRRTTVPCPNEMETVRNFFNVVVTQLQANA